MQRLLIVPLLATLLLPGAAVADTVLLTNGNSFEGLVTQVSDSEVSIRLAFGEIKLPRSSVASFERQSSALESYFSRRDRLEKDDADAGDWLVLARWARSHNLEHSAFEAARRAALREPTLDGLGSFMRAQGYVFDPELERWLPEAESMRRRGYVRVGGEWMHRDEMAARQRGWEEQRRERQDRRDRDRMNRMLDLLAISQLERLEEERTRRQLWPAYGTGYPIASFPGVWGYGVYVGSERPEDPVSPAHVGSQRAPRPHVWQPVIDRQPGSILPIPSTAKPSHGGRILRPGG